MKIVRSIVLLFYVCILCSCKKEKDAGFFSRTGAGRGQRGSGQDVSKMIRGAPSIPFYGNEDFYFPPGLISGRAAAKPVRLQVSKTSLP